MDHAVWSTTIRAMQRHCIGCDRTKDISEFSPKGEGRWHPRCKACRRAEARARRAGAKPDEPTEPKSNVVHLAFSESEQPESVEIELDPDVTGFLATANHLQEEIEDKMPDVLARASGHLALVRLLGPKIVLGHATTADVSAYSRALDKIVDLFETRRKEMTNVDVGQSILDDWRSFRSTPVVMAGA